jgi:hypothetical protein
MPGGGCPPDQAARFRNIEEIKIFLIDKRRRLIYNRRATLMADTMRFDNASRGVSKGERGWA